MKVVFEVLDHAVARIPINPQEGVVIPNTIETLSELFLWEPPHRVFRGKGFYRPLLALDVALDVSPGAPFRDDLLRRNGNEIVPEDICNLVLL